MVSLPPPPYVRRTPKKDAGIQFAPGQRSGEWGEGVTAPRDLAFIRFGIGADTSDAPVLNQHGRLLLQFATVSV